MKKKRTIEKLKKINLKRSSLISKADILVNKCVVRSA